VEEEEEQEASASPPPTPTGLRGEVVTTHENKVHACCADAESGLLYYVYIHIYIYMYKDK
jgi:hypothetical protein